MAFKRLSMRNIHRVPRLFFEAGLSIRAIARSIQTRPRPLDGGRVHSPGQDCGTVLAVAREGRRARARRAVVPHRRGVGSGGGADHHEGTGGRRRTRETLRLVDPCALEFGVPLHGHISSPLAYQFAHAVAVSWVRFRRAPHRPRPSSASSSMPRSRAVPSRVRRHSPRAPQGRWCTRCAHAGCANRSSPPAGG